MTYTVDKIRVVSSITSTSDFDFGHLLKYVEELDNVQNNGRFQL